MRERHIYRTIFKEGAGEGPWPCHFCEKPCNAENVHHLNHDHEDNRFENLAPCHKRCHLRHHKTGHLRPDNQSGYPGVHYRKGRGIWVARRVVDGKRIYVGSSATAEGAAELLEEKSR